MAEYRKPLPVAGWEETKEYWEGCRVHELRIQRCRDCGTYRWYPRPLCHECSSTNTEWVKASGRGTLYSWTVVFHPTSAVWTDEVPYIVAIVELEEGVRMLSNMVDCPSEELKVGVAVDVAFDDVTDSVTLPNFNPRREPKTS